VSKSATTEEDTMRRILIAMLVALAAVALAACSSGGDDEGAGEAAVTEAEAREVSAEGGGEAVDEAVSVSQAPRGGVLAQVGPRVVQTASLTLSVPRDRFSERVDEARTLAAGLGGFVVSSTASQGPDRALERGTLVLRVPERSYAQAMEALSALGRVESREETGQDVSQELVDLEARARHLEAVERQLLEFLDRAENVSAALAVQSRLNDVQLELERVRGRLRYLDDQVAYATISLSIHERGAAAVSGDGDTAWGIVDAWRTAARGFVTVVGWLLVAAVTVAPVVLLIVLAFFAVRRFARRAIPAWRKP
jgi:predicted small secreted protein